MRLTSEPLHESISNHRSGSALTASRIPLSDGNPFFPEHRLLCAFVVILTSDRSVELGNRAGIDSSPRLLLDPGFKLGVRRFVLGYVVDHRFLL